MDAMAAVQANHALRNPELNSFYVLHLDKRKSEVPRLYLPVSFRQYVKNEKGEWVYVVKQNYSFIRKTSEKIILMGQSLMLEHLLNASSGVLPVYLYATIDNQGIGTLDSVNVLKVKTIPIDNRGGTASPVYAFHLELE